MNTRPVLIDQFGNPLAVDITGISDGDVLTYDSGTGLWVPAAASGGVTDHGALTGLGDDDHSQYATNTEFDDHNARHESGGADAIKLDNLAAPDDNTDLNATTSAHGLLPKLGGGSTNFLRADGTWNAPSGGGGSGIDSGTSFPGSPADNDLFHRTDRDLLYFYDGTRWLTLDVYQAFGTSISNSSTSGVIDYIAVHATFSLYIEDLLANIFISTTNNGSNYWTIGLFWRDSANAETSLGSANTSADSGATWLRKTVSVNAVLSSSAYVLGVSYTKTGAPGTRYGQAVLRYRLVG